MRFAARGSSVDTRSDVRAMARVGALSAVVALAAANVSAAQQLAPAPPNAPFLRINPDRILIAHASGLKPCGECHQEEHKVWKATKHATGFDNMHRKESASDILKAMGFRVAKRQEAICMRCHYTVGPERTAVAGVSCESCHGPARDWINVHNRFVGARDRSQETPSNREARIAASRAAGMLSPSTDPYGVASNCFDCHTVPNERLVNEGGHTVGTRSFDLLAGVSKIRHNFLDAGGPGTTNRELSPGRRRVMFVVGRIVAYEYALRGYALATKDSTYSSAMLKRVTAAVAQLQEVAATVRVTEVDEVLSAGRKAKLIPNNRADLEGAADRIRTIGQRFVSSGKGGALAALDPLLSGSPPAEAVVASAAAATSPSVSDSRPPAVASSATTPAAGRGTTATPSAAAAAPARAELPGTLKSRPDWFQAAGRSGFAESGDCAGCHRQASAWWSKDKHSETGARRLLGEDAKARAIAVLYGIGVEGMKRPANICMSCHATVDEARRSAAAPIEAGVSCESCHGAGGKFIEPHQQGGNPQLGMRALKQAADRAQTCAGCHRISDVRLLAAGHSSGADYDIGRAMEKIKHWPDQKADRGREKRHAPAYTLVEDGALRSAFANAVRDRPIPKVTVATLPTAAPQPAANPTSRTAAAPGALPAQAGELSQRAATPRRSALPPTVPSTLSPGRVAPTVSVTLEPIPPTDRLTIEDLLLLVKKRVERIHAAVSRGTQQ